MTRDEIERRVQSIKDCLLGVRCTACSKWHVCKRQSTYMITYAVTEVQELGAAVLEALDEAAPKPPAIERPCFVCQDKPETCRPGRFMDQECFTGEWSSCYYGGESPCLAEHREEEG